METFLLQYSYGIFITTTIIFSLLVGIFSDTERYLHPNFIIVALLMVLINLLYVLYAKEWIVFFLGFGMSLLCMYVGKAITDASDYLSWKLNNAFSDIYYLWDVHVTIKEQSCKLTKVTG